MCSGVDGSAAVGVGVVGNIVVVIGIVDDDDDEDSVVDAGWFARGIDVDVISDGRCDFSSWCSVSLCERENVAPQWHT